jgi:hypothetical protein
VEIFDKNGIVQSRPTTSNVPEQRAVSATLGHNQAEHVKHRTEISYFENEKLCP